MNILDKDIPLPYMVKLVTIDPKITSKYPNGYFKSKNCRYCEKQFQPVAPSHHYCSNECAIDAGADSYLFRNYKISLETYRKIYREQEGKCFICRQEGFSLKEVHKTSLLVDHDHLTGEVRGLLCPNCNRALGLFKDDIEYLKRAIEYINKPKISKEESSKSKLFRNRKESTIKTLDKDTVFKIYDDIFINKLRCKDIEYKYGISRNTKRNLEIGKSHKEYLEEYQKGATTISNESKLQANGS